MKEIHLNIRFYAIGENTDSVEINATDSEFKPIWIRVNELVRVMMSAIYDTFPNETSVAKLDVESNTISYHSSDIDISVHVEPKLAYELMNDPYLVYERAIFCKSPSTDIKYRIYCATVNGVTFRNWFDLKDYVKLLICNQLDKGALDENFTFYKEIVSQYLQNSLENL